MKTVGIMDKHGLQDTIKNCDSSSRTRSWNQYTGRVDYSVKSTRIRGSFLTDPESGRGTGEVRGFGLRVERTVETEQVLVMFLMFNF
jgi:hypothetical protein